MLKRLYLSSATIIVFLLLLRVGFNLAENKFLWLDEIYTQLRAVAPLSYRDILEGPTSEGNNCPLFYLIQKVIVDATYYQTPQAWLQGHKQKDASSRFILRINPVLFMSLSLTVIFFYFSRYYSWLTGIYALCVALSSYMVWLYWAEARPYALWFFLTTVQSLLFLHLFRKDVPQRILIRWLALVHVLLALTISIGTGQVVIVSFLVWLSLNRNWKNYIGLTIIPCVIGLYYFSLARPSPLWVGENPMKFIFPCIPEDRIILFALYALFVIVYYRRQDIRGLQFMRSQSGVNYLAMTLFSLLMGLVCLALFKLREVPGQAGHEISMRFFIYLTPIGIIATALFSDQLIRSLQGHRWHQSNVMIILAGLLVIGFYRNCAWVIGIY